MMLENGLRTVKLPQNPLLAIHLSFRPQIRKVKPKRVLRHTEAQLAVRAVGGQQAALEQR